MTTGEETYDQDFQPISKKRPLKLTNKWATPTGIAYKKGYTAKDGYIALQFFRNNKLINTLVSKTDKSWKSKHENIWNLIQELGGQSPDHARSQREIALTGIMDTYLKSIGYTSTEQPQLNETTPDILAIKKPYSCFIELKAYFGTTIVGEAEVAQIIKYYNIVKSTAGIMKSYGLDNSVPPKFLLITTGKLPSMEKNSIFNGDLKELDEEKQLEFIKNKYKTINKKLGYARTLEGRDTMFIYKYAYDKFKKQIKYKYEIPPRVEQINRPRKLDKFIENSDDVDMLLIPAGVFSRILWLSNLRKEQDYFERIRKSWLSDLVLDKNLINYTASS